MLHLNMKYLIQTNDSKKSEICKVIGVSRSTLDKYLDGTWPVPSNVVISFAQYYNVSPGLLFEEKESDIVKTTESKSIFELIYDQNKYLIELIEQQKKQLEFFQGIFKEYIEKKH